jgi:hypothetical protein
MSKVRVDYEDVFIKTFTRTEKTPEKYSFNFNSEWVKNNSPTKKICIRKIEVFSMTFTVITRFSFDTPGNNRFINTILFTLIG